MSFECWVFGDLGSRPRRLRRGGTTRRAAARAPGPSARAQERTRASTGESHRREPRQMGPGDDEDHDREERHTPVIPPVHQQRGPARPDPGGGAAGSDTRRPAPRRGRGRSARHTPGASASPGPPTGRSAATRRRASAGRPSARARQPAAESSTSSSRLPASHDLRHSAPVGRRIRETQRGGRQREIEKRRAAGPRTGRLRKMGRRPQHGKDGGAADEQRRGDRAAGGAGAPTAPYQRLNQQADRARS